MTAPLLWTRSLLRDRWARVGLGVVAALVLLAVLAPWLAPGDPFRGDLAASLRPPSLGFLLGSDAQGRDVLSSGPYRAPPPPFPAPHRSAFSGAATRGDVTCCPASSTAPACRSPSASSARASRSRSASRSASSPDSMAVGSTASSCASPT